MEALELLDRAVLALDDRRLDDARERARAALKAARGAPAEIVFRAASLYLDALDLDRSRDVYFAPEAFRAFIRGGGNVRLYEATSAALREAHADEARHRGRPLTLLDVGCGDGMALVPALSDAVRSVVLVEPSIAMLDRAKRDVEARGLDVSAFAGGVEDWLASDPRAPIDLAEATFALQSIPREARAIVLRGLRERAARLLLVEFDVPRLGARADVLRHRIERYAQGISEYGAADGLVAQGFLMPMFFSSLGVAGGPAKNHEQSIDAWLDELRAAGFAQITTSPIDPYWWADAVLVDARV